MTTTTDITADSVTDPSTDPETPAAPVTPTFTTSDGLRALLRRFADPADHASWACSEGDALARYCVHRFAPLARKYRQPVEDAAAYAFEVMCQPGLLDAVDPWAVVTTGVKRSVVAAFTGDSLLCGDRAARHAVDVHDPHRISDRDWTFLESHLVTDASDDHLHAARPTKAGDVAPDELDRVLEDTARLLQALGWRIEEARIVLEYVSRRVETTGTTTRAFEYLRHDHIARGRFNLPQDAWTTLLLVLLGSPDPDRSLTPGGRGILLRLLAGCTVADLLDDDALVAALHATTGTDRSARTGHADA